MASPFLPFGRGSLDKALNTLQSHLLRMPCFYPEGSPEEWCERHTADHHMLLQLKSQRASA